MVSLTPEISAFVRVVELGSFAAVANESGYTPSGISRMVSRLEDALQAKLLQRSTRRLALTQEGERYLSHARAILAMVETAELDVSSAHGRPQGHLHVNCGTACATHILAPIMAEWSDAFPDISVDVSVSDRRIDPIADRVDVTIRVGPLPDSDMIAVPLGEVRRIIAASPAYLSKHGEPKCAEDLKDHNCLLLSGFPHQSRWPFLVAGKRIEVRVSGRFASDSAETLLNAALAGTGIIRLGDFLGADALSSGRLVSILEDTHIDDPQPITVLITPGRQNLPRVRVFVDFVRSKIKTG